MEKNQPRGITHAVTLYSICHGLSFCLFVPLCFSPAATGTAHATSPAMVRQHSQCSWAVGQCSPPLASCETTLQGLKGRNISCTSKGELGNGLSSSLQCSTRTGGHQSLSLRCPHPTALRAAVTCAHLNTCPALTAPAPPALGAPGSSSAPRQPQCQGWTRLHVQPSWEVLYLLGEVKFGEVDSIFYKKSEILCLSQKRFPRKQPPTKSSLAQRPRPHFPSSAVSPATPGFWLQWTSARNARG